MKKILVVILAIVIGFLAFFFRPTSKKISVGGKTVKIEIARTEAQHAQGLSSLRFLCSDCGLLFLFNEKGFYPFWMKEMYFDIDILWIADNKVVDITYSAKKPEASEFESPKITYQSQFPVDKVLEVNAGWTEKNRIKIGDPVTF